MKKLAKMKNMKCFITLDIYQMLYCKMAEEVGLPKPDRNSIVRPLNEGKKID